ncbi:MAG: O-antigen ligase family protein [Caldilineaceae bacterium]|nr:O-antigen ligase family protein [Caldilineaceae bacterium]
MQSQCGNRSPALGLPQTEIDALLLVDAKLPGARASDTIHAMSLIPFPPHHRLLWLAALLFGLAALSWFLIRPQDSPASLPLPTRTESLEPGTIASMDSPVFVYDRGWQISSKGADPAEPADAWTQPSGRLFFDYEGAALALSLAMGDYWGFLYVTVDGKPANQLPTIPGNPNGRGEDAGYKPLLAPERQTPDGPSPQWILVHVAPDRGPHQVEIEVWRSWGQTPLRAVAVDALPSSPLPSWPGVALGLVAVWAAVWGMLRRQTADGRRQTGTLRITRYALRIIRAFPALPDAILFLLLSVGLLVIAVGVIGDQWLVTVAGLLLLALVGMQRPLLWTGALLFGLPFYLYPLPILPGRSLNLVEIGIWGGLVLLAGHWLGQTAVGRQQTADGRRQTADGRVPSPQSPVPDPQSPIPNPLLFLAALIGLALVATAAAEQREMALREWRTIFLAAGGFALLLVGALRTEPHPRIPWTMIFLWLLGGSAASSIALWQYASGQMLIEAEGVNRVRALYGSPNNLALYLERTVAVGLALALFHQQSAGKRLKWQIGTESALPNPQSPIPSLLLWLLVLPQLAALLLTFSKGALFLALPTILAALAVGGYWLRRGNLSRLLWGLAAVALIVIVGLTPFLGTERFRSLLNFDAGATGGLRLNLWRSSLSMAFDHPWLGVGPDNFLYAYRSGYILPAAWQDPDLNHPHNLLLDWWTRLGVGGVMLAMGWLLTGGKRLWQGIFEPARAALNLGCLAAILGALAHGLIDASYALPDLMIIWVLLLGLTEDGSANQISKRNAPSPFEI